MIYFSACLLHFFEIMLDENDKMIGDSAKENKIFIIASKLNIWKFFFFFISTFVQNGLVFTGLNREEQAKIGFLSRRGSFLLFSPYLWGRKVFPGCTGRVRWPY